MAFAAPIAELVGGAAEGAGKVKANRDQAKIEIANANRLEELEEVTRLNSRRKERLFRENVSEFEAKQVGSFAKAGVDLSGSALNKLNQTAGRAEDELTAMKMQAEFESRQAKERANQSLGRAKKLESIETTGLTFGTSLLGGVSRAAQSAPVGGF